MSVWGIARVKDEADIIGATVEHMLGEVDRVLVADNGSTDGTRDILADISGVEIIDDPEVGYYQAFHMSRLAAQAAEGGAEWVVPFDADEWWYSPFGRIADVLREHRIYAIATAELYDHVATALDPDDPNPFRRIGWRRSEPGPLPKVAAKARPAVTIQQGNHGADYGDTITGQLVVRHYPYRSPQQFERKVRNGAAAYAATDLPDDVGAHWRQYGAILDSGGPEALAEVFRKWYWREIPGADLIIDGERQPPLIFDPCPSRSSSPSQEAASTESAPSTG